MDELPRRSRWLQLAGVLVSIVSLAGVIVWGLQQPAPELPSSAGDRLTLMGAVALLGATTVLRSERWRYLIRRAGGSLSAVDGVGLTAVGFMGNSVLPARGGDALRVVLGRGPAGTSARVLIGTLVAERILDVIVLLGTFGVVAYLVLTETDKPGMGLLLFVVGGLVLVAAAGLIVHRLRPSQPWARRLADFVLPMSVSTRGLLDSRHGLPMLALTVGIWAGDSAVWLITSYAVGLDLSPLDALYLVSLAAVFVLIPAGPGYAGTLDGGVIYGVRALGGSGAAALSYLIVLRFVLVVPLTVVGLILLLTRYRGAAALRPRVDEEPA